MCSVVNRPPRGYTTSMRFRLGMVTGFAAGYYLGAKAGRQRYEQINRQLTRLKRSEAFEQAVDQAKTVVEEGVDKARAVVESRTSNGHGYEGETDPAPAPAVSDITDSDPPGPPKGLGGYSSSK